MSGLLIPKRLVKELKKEDVNVIYTLLSGAGGII